MFLHSLAKLRDSAHAMGHSHTDIPRNNSSLKLPQLATEAGQRHCFEFPISYLNKGTSYLLWLVKDSLKIAKRGS